MNFNKRTILKKQVVDAGIGEVWEAWTSEQGLKSFLCPDCSIELKIGGKFEIYFLTENEYGLKGSEGCKVLSFVPGKMLSFSWNAPPTIPTVRDNTHKAWIVIFMDETAEGTLVELHHLGFLNGNDWNETIDYFEKAWDIVLQNLKQKFNNE